MTFAKDYASAGARRAKEAAASQLRRRGIATPGDRTREMDAERARIDALAQRVADIEVGMNSLREALDSLREALDSLRGGLVDDLESRTGTLRMRVNDLDRLVMMPEFKARSVNLGVSGDPDAPFMEYSTPVSADFEHPMFAAYCKQIDHRIIYHRKLWEWIYILHKLEQYDMLQPGKRGLGFGVGTERLPAVFAKAGAQVLATDGDSEAWDYGDQHSTSLDQLFYPTIVDNDVVRQLVEHRSCDMNDIPADLQGFDFTWSACAFEHLGSIEHGLEFVANSVNTLKPGGVAVHTTEFNLSPGGDTVTTGDTVLFRLHHLQSLLDRLKAEGHEAEMLQIGPVETALDAHVDLPPYSPVHMRIEVGRYVCTSVGIVVRRGEGSTQSP